VMFRGMILCGSKLNCGNTPPTSARGLVMPGLGG